MGSGERSEKIRTYNFPDDRVTDHRIGLTVHNLPGLLEGDLDRVVEPLLEADQARRLADIGARGDVTAAVRDVLARAAAALRDGGSPTPRLDAEVLLAHVLGTDRSWLHAHPEATVEPAAFDALVDRRRGGEPIAYLRGFKEWRSLRIRTDARALVPRPETELLLDQAIDEVVRRMARDREPIVAWEVATGTGAVAVALALRFREALALGRLRLIASDVSPDALELAAENLEVHGVASLVDLACADLLEPGGVDPPATERGGREPAIRALRRGPCAGPRAWITSR